MSAARGVGFSIDVGCVINAGYLEGVALNPT